MTDPTTLPRCDESDEERLREVYARHARSRQPIARNGVWWLCDPIEGVEWVQGDDPQHKVLRNSTERRIFFGVIEGFGMVVMHVEPESEPPQPTRLGLALVRLKYALLRWL